MDIFAKDPVALANEGAVLELRDVDGSALLQPDGSPVTLTLLGADSDAYVQTSNGLTNRNFRKGFRPGTVTAESSLADQIALLAKATIDWSGIGLGEDSTTFSEDAAKRLYRIAFIREQAQEFVTDRGNFAKASPKR